MTPERVFVIGAPGSGKTTLARQIGRKLDLPVHNLDEVARVGGGTGPQRSSAERAASVVEIIASGRWVAEGVHLAWTNDLLEAAEVIVWLDHVAWQRSSGRIVKRFVNQALAEARRQRGWRRFLRVRDYGRRLRELAVAIPESRDYERAPAGSDGAGSPTVTRAATAAVLAPYEHKLVHCRTSADIDTALRTVLSPA